MQHSLNTVRSLAILWHYCVTLFPITLDCNFHNIRGYCALCRDHNCVKTWCIHCGACQCLICRCLYNFWFVQLHLHSQPSVVDFLINLKQLATIFKLDFLVASCPSGRLQPKNPAQNCHKLLQLSVVCSSWWFFSRIFSFTLEAACNQKSS